jgi:Flp pilus assembly pilin Flp
MKFRSFLRRFRNEESGQDLAEYCLLTALLALVAAAIFVHASGGIQAIWGTANSQLMAGDSVTNSTSAGSSKASTPTQ